MGRNARAVPLTEQWVRAALAGARRSMRAPLSAGLQVPAEEGHDLGP